MAAVDRRTTAPADSEWANCWKGFNARRIVPTGAAPPGWSLMDAALSHKAAMLLEHDAYELASRPHTRLVKELLKRGLHRSLRDAQAGADLLVGEPVEDPPQH